jgi:hypothetical protein
MMDLNEEMLRILHMRDRLIRKRFVPGRGSLMADKFFQPFQDNAMYKMYSIARAIAHALDPEECQTMKAFEKSGHATWRFIERRWMLANEVLWAEWYVTIKGEVKLFIDKLHSVPKLSALTMLTHEYPKPIRDPWEFDGPVRVDPPAMDFQMSKDFILECPHSVLNVASNADYTGLASVEHPYPEPREDDASSEGLEGEEVVELSDDEDEQTYDQGSSPPPEEGKDAEPEGDPTEANSVGPQEEKVSESEVQMDSGTPQPEMEDNSTLPEPSASGMDTGAPAEISSDSAHHADQFMDALDEAERLGQPTWDRRDQQ